MAALNTTPLLSLTLHVPQRGVWIADCILDAGALPNELVTLTAANANFIGTVDPLNSGVFRGKARVRVVGGANGWSDAVPARHYHNDARVKVSTVLNALASEVGESIDDAPSTLLNRDYARIAGTAARALESLAFDWWMDFDGITHTKPRIAVPLAASAEVEVLEFNAGDRILTLGADTIGAAGVRIGSIVRDKLTGPVRVDALTLMQGPKSSRVLAWVSDL